MHYKKKIKAELKVYLSNYLSCNLEYKEIKQVDPSFSRDTYSLNDS